MALQVPEGLGAVFTDEEPVRLLRRLVPHLDQLLRQIGFRVNSVLPKDGSEPVEAWIEFGEIASPAAPAANRARLFVRDNGAGKTQLVVQFASGAAQVLATEP